MKGNKTQQEVNFVVQPQKPCLDISSAAALRLGRLLKELSHNLIEIDQEGDMEFAIVWSQLFTMYGLANMAEGFMVDKTPYLETVSEYMGVMK
jgi:hypothetical protein